MYANYTENVTPAAPFYGTMSFDTKKFSHMLFLDTSDAWRAPENRAAADASRILHVGIKLSRDLLRFTHCAVSRADVQVAVECATARDCRVDMLRPSHSDPRLASATPLDIYDVALHLFWILPAIGRPRSAMGQSLTERVLNDTARMYQEKAYSFDLSLLTPEQLLSRLALVFNTYYIGALPFQPGAFFLRSAYRQPDGSTVLNSPRRCPQGPYNATNLLNSCPNLLFAHGRGVARRRRSRCTAAAGCGRTCFWPAPVSCSSRALPQASSAGARLCPTCWATWPA